MLAASISPAAAAMEIRIRSTRMAPLFEAREGGPPVILHDRPGVPPEGRRSAPAIRRPARVESGPASRLVVGPPRANVDPRPGPPRSIAMPAHQPYDGV